MSECKFRAMCKAHDLTYTFSDDHRIWMGGLQSYKSIRAAADELGSDIANKIWNEVVDEKISEESRERFYW